jgi:hypothetical protein
MSDERTIERLLAHLRAHVAELRRMERDGAEPEQVEERRRLIQRLQRHLAYSVVDVLGVPRRPRLG